MRECDVETMQIGEGWFTEQSGGLNRYYADLITRLPGVGVDVTGLVTGSDEVAARSGGTVRAFAPRRASLPVRLGRVRMHARRVLTEQPRALAVAHFALYAAPCLDLLRGRPLVVHFHGPWAEESRAEGAGAITARFKHWMEAAVCRRATRFIVLSHAFARVLETCHAVDAGLIRVIPGGVDTVRFTPSCTRRDARRRLGWPNDRPIALAVRRLVRRMGLEDLIASVKQARSHVPDLLVLVAGRGPLAEELEARRASEGVLDHVRFLGFVPDEELSLAYRAADLSIVPSVSLEGFGLIVAESLAAGTPVLVTAVGGLPETVEGLAPQCVIHEPGPGALAAAVAAALRGSLPMPAADACIRHARERFDWSVVVERVRAVYAEAMQ
jgi:glycosyltransferase involved in cell wall biosynthesis